MSRTRLLRRLERLASQVEALESLIDTRGLESLSDEQLAAWCFLLEEGDVGSRPQSEQARLWQRVLSDPEYVASVLAEHEPEPRSATEAVTERVPVASPDREQASAARGQPPAPEVQERPEEPPRIRRSTDPPGPSPRRGEWWRVTFRPYRPPGWRPRVVQERAFEDE